MPDGDKYYRPKDKREVNGEGKYPAPVPSLLFLECTRPTTKCVPAHSFVLKYWAPKYPHS